MKFFNYLMMAALCLMTASCSNEDQDVQTQTSEEVLVPVMVRVNGFSISQEEFPGTRATTPVGEYNGVKALTLAFYKSDGTEVFKHTQLRDDNTTFTTFGVFICYLPQENYTMVVIANGGDNAITLTNKTLATYGENRVMDTFAATKAVNITNTNAVNVTATLDRVVSAVAVRSTDNRPAGVTHLRFTYSKGGKSFNPTTGLATSNTGFVNLMGLSGNVGSTTYSGGYLFLASNTQTMDVTIETLDADENVLFSKTITDVPLERNRQTTLTGAIYSSAVVSANSFLISGTWLTENNVEF